MISQFETPGFFPTSFFSYDQIKYVSLYLAINYRYVRNLSYIKLFGQLVVEFKVNSNKFIRNSFQFNYIRMRRSFSGKQFRLLKFVCILESLTGEWSLLFLITCGCLPPFRHFWGFIYLKNIKLLVKWFSQSSSKFLTIHITKTIFEKSLN